MLKNVCRIMGKGSLKIVKENLVKKKLRIADVFLPQKSLGQESA